MTTCKPTFSNDNNAPAYELYQSLFKKGITCDSLDQGVSIINYDGKSCPTESMKTCVTGNSDGFLEASEVFEFAFDNYEKYQKIIEGALEQKLPWVLDDRDPETIFDAKVRKKVQGAIDKLKGILKTKGVKEGTEEYKEMLAVGLFYLAEVPDKDFIQNNEARFRVRFDEDTKELVDRGLGDFKEYLKKKGGFRVEGENLLEYTALEAITRKQGKCTENSKILFAFFKMAGLKPVFVHIPHEGVKTQDSQVQEAINRLPQGTDHMCIGLLLKGGFRLFDTALFDSNARHEKFIPFSLRQSFSYFLVNSGVVWAKDGYYDWAIDDYDAALKIDSRLALAYYNRGIAWSKKGEIDKAIADYNEALNIDPKLLLAFYNRSLTWISKYQTQIAALLENL